MKYGLLIIEGISDEVFNLFEVVEWPTDRTRKIILEQSESECEDNTGQKQYIIKSWVDAKLVKWKTDKGTAQKDAIINARDTYNNKYKDHPERQIANDILLIVDQKDYYQLGKTSG